MKVYGLIPCRLKSKRLPEKPLKIIKNYPMLVHVYKRLEKSDCDEVYICTGDVEVADVCKEYNLRYVLTKKEHENGTERCNEAASILKIKNEDSVLNVQGDEPLVDPSEINLLISEFKKNKYDLIVPFSYTDKKNDTNEVKVVTDKFGRYLYLSRNDIPSSFRGNMRLKKQIGVFIYPKKILSQIVAISPSEIEISESIELLRAVENGYVVNSIEFKNKLISVDTENDLKKATELMEVDPLYKKGY